MQITDEVAFKKFTAVPKRVDRFVRKLGLVVEWSTPRDDVKYTWDGHVLRPVPDCIEMQLHDVAHWIVASAWRRRCVEFGIGSDPYRDSDAHFTVTYNFAEREEYFTCEVQICLAIWLRLRLRLVLDGVSMNHEKLSKSHISRIKGLGIIPTKDMPRILRKLQRLHMLSRQ